MDTKLYERQAMRDQEIIQLFGVYTREASISVVGWTKLDRNLLDIIVSCGPK